MTQHPGSIHFIRILERTSQQLGIILRMLTSGWDPVQIQEHGMRKRLPNSDNLVDGKVFELQNGTGDGGGGGMKINHIPNGRNMSTSERVNINIWHWGGTVISLPGEGT